jgi:ribosome-binding factor A
MFKQEKVTDLVKVLASKFLAEEANRNTLITVTSAKVTKDMSRAWIFFTVYPEQFEKDALAFAKRKRSEFREYVEQNARLRKVPFFEFEIDAGEKNRQRVDEQLTKE